MPWKETSPMDQKVAIYDSPLPFLDQNRGQLAIDKKKYPSRVDPYKHAFLHLL